MIFRSRTQAFFERAKLSDFNFHDFRHTALTNMVNAGMPESIIMMISGHKSKDVFVRYVNFKAQDVLNYFRHSLDTSARHIKKV